MGLDPILHDLAASRRRAGLVALGPVAAGAVLALFLYWLQPQYLPVFPAILFGIGVFGGVMALRMARIRQDVEFLPRLAALLGMDCTPLSTGPVEVLAPGIAPAGESRIVRNIVSGEREGRAWRGGELLIHTRSRNRRRAVLAFRGLLVQAAAMPGQPDFILMPRRFAPHGSDLPPAGTADHRGETWRLWCEAARAEGLPAMARQFLDALPPPGKGEHVLAFAAANGWLHILVARRGDLFAIGGGPAREDRLRAVADDALHTMRRIEALAAAALSADDPAG